MNPPSPSISMREVERESLPLRIVRPSGSTGRQTDRPIQRLREELRRGLKIEATLAPSCRMQ